MTNMAEFP